MRTPIPLALAVALALTACKKEEEAAAPPRPVLSVVVTPTALPGTRMIVLLWEICERSRSERARL